MDTDNAGDLKLVRINIKNKVLTEIDEIWKEE